MSYDCAVLLSQLREHQEGSDFLLLKRCLMIYLRKKFQIHFFQHREKKIATDTKFFFCNLVIHSS